jgi:hypothetical protein
VGWATLVFVCDFQCLFIFTNFFQHFITHYSTIMAPLTCLTWNINLLFRELKLPSILWRFFHDYPTIDSHGPFLTFCLGNEYFLLCIKHHAFTIWKNWSSSY